MTGSEDQVINLSGIPSQESVVGSTPVEPEKTKLHEDDVLYGIKSPKSSCNKCHGRGYGAFSAGKPVPCSCLFRTGKGENITVKELYAIQKAERHYN